MAASQKHEGRCKGTVTVSMVASDQVHRSRAVAYATASLKNKPVAV